MGTHSDKKPILKLKGFLWPSCDSIVPVLRGERVTLRALKMRDDRDMFEYGTDTEVTKHVLWETYDDIRDARAYIRFVRRQYAAGDAYIFGIEYERKLIGTIGFMWVNEEFRSAEIGYSMNRAYWNRGLMTEALRVLLRYAFGTLRLNRVEAQHETGNPASGRVMQKAGMRYEGTLRQRVRNKGHFSDVHLYAILSQDARESGLV